MNKKFTKLMAALALLVFMTPSLAGWGQTRGSVTYVFSDHYSSNTTLDGTAISLDNAITATFNRNGGTSPQYYTNGTAVRWYAKNTLVIEADQATISNIVFTFGTGDGSNTITANVGSYSNGSWSSDTGEPSVTFTVGGTSGNRRVSAIEVTYTTSGGDPIQLSAPTDFSATAGDTQAEFTWNAVSHATGYTISYTPAGGSETTTTINSGSATSATITGLTNSTAYTCKIMANGDGTNYINSDYSSTITVTPVAFYDVTIDDGITGGSVEASPMSAPAGTEISLTANPIDGYGFTLWNVYKTGDQTTSVEVTNDKFNMPTYDVTVSATFTPYTVTLDAGSGTVNGEANTTWNVSMNSGNLPDAISPCSDIWSFDGWSTTAVGEQTTTAPSYVNTAYVPTSNITLYAVYTKTESSGSSFDGNNGGDFMIYATTNGDNPTNYFATGGVNNKALSSTVDVSSASTYTLEKLEATGQFAIKIGNSYIASTSSSADLSSSNNACAWTISSNSNGTWSVKIPNSSRDLIFRTTGVFKNYSSNNTNNSTEYFNVKIGSPSTTYYHSTPNCIPTVATPSFDVPEGTYDETQLVLIECATDDAAIYYTLNGDEPTNEVSGTNFLYDENEGVEISVTTTLKAKAFKEGMNPSVTKTATYTILHDVTEPTLPASQLFTTTTYSVAITVPANTTVYYTTDGSAPTNESTQYTAAFDIDATTTVKAIAYDGDGCHSDVVSAIFTKAYTLAGAKALYSGSAVSDVVIDLTGVQFIAKHVGNHTYTYVQQGTTGLLLYGANTNNWTNGDMFTAGTVTGTITKFGQNMEMTNFTFASVATEAGTLTASATNVGITNITGSFSTYEDRYVSLTSLEMDLDNLELSDGTNTLAIYDQFSVLGSATQPNDGDDVVVTGIVTSYTTNNTTTYQIVPIALTDITTGKAASLPTLDPVGGATAGEAVTTATVKITPAASTSVTYVFGNGDEVTTTEEVTVDVPSTSAVSLTLTVSRDFYVDNVAEYYYKSDATAYIVYYYDNDDNPFYYDEVIAGASLTLEDISAPNGFEFMGWTTSTISGVSATAPDPLYTAGTSITVNGDMDLYAVFALEGETSVSYNKVDGYSSISEGTYLIAVNKVDSDKYNFANGQAASGHAGVEATGVATATSYTASSIPEGALEYTLAGNNTNGFSIHCSTGYLNATSSKNSLSYGNSATETWIFSDKDDGAVLTGASNGTKTSCNSTTAASAIRNYASTGNYYDPLYFFKKTETTTYNNYCTSVAAIEDTNLPLNGESELTEDYTISGVNYLNTYIIVPNGITLTIEGTFGNSEPEYLVVEDGGQLIANNPVQATVQKGVTAYSDATGLGNTDGWHFIALPIDCNSFAPTTAMLTGTYDLYRLNPSSAMWENYRTHEGNAASGFNLESGRGYLYANNAGFTIDFAGEVKAAAATQNVTISQGWNLIGNPFTYNVYVNRPYYRMKADKKGIEIVESYQTNTIAPCTGVVVKATSASETVVFSKTAPGTSTGNQGSVQMTLAQQTTNRGTAATLDNAIVSFNEGSELGKFYFGTQNANLYIPQGTEEYAIVSSNGQGTMPVNFRANENGQYTLTVNPENVEMNYLHLIDNMTGNDIDLLANPSYSFNAKVTDYESRFKLVFAAANQNSEEGNDNFAFFSNGQYIIANEGEATLQVIDIMGRILSSETINGSVSKSINAPVGVYMLRLINGENVKVQKMVVR